ncbi:phospholipase D-like domain-containing protein [Marinicellulosiphila megalodicopiae]|uniref:phospholipase D-like domain-containing protein n=1 Tax=Marinicellulosiphila megalodicopiae TaxID=2724896 RepID=UPI003BAE5C81
MKLLVNGQAAFDCIFKRIDEARHSIEIGMFIWRNDQIGNALAQKLLLAADRGVKITIRKDKLGAIFEYCEETRQSFFHHNLSFWMKFQAWFLHISYPMQGKSKHCIQTKSPLLKRIISHENIIINCEQCLNDHSKYYIFDHAEMIIGGVNVEDKEVDMDVEGKKYHDYMVHINNEIIVKSFRKSLEFGVDIHRDIHCDKNKKEIDFIINAFDKNKKRMQAREALVNRIEQAQSTIVIVMAYISDLKLMNSIKKAVFNGVKVTIYIPRKANFQNDVNLFFISKLMKKCNNQIKINLCDDMIHGKLIWIDEKYVNFGSINFNKQAMDKLQECNIGMRSDVYLLNESIIKSITEIQENSQQIHCPTKLDYDGYNVFLERMLG